MQNIDTNEDSEGGLNNRMRRDIAFYSPRMSGINGDFSIANKALTDYSRAYSHSDFNTSGVTNKNDAIPEGTCFLDNQPDYLEKQWTELGPFGDNSIPRHGQIHNFDFSPNFATDSTMYACSYYSGLYQSTDKGQSWSVLNQNRKLPFAGVGDIEIHPNSSNIIFASTGKNDMKFYLNLSYSESNNLFTSGIFRSTDGGINWEEIMDTTFWTSFGHGGNIKKMYIDPYNTNSMYVATSEGIWYSYNILSTDPSWQKISAFTGSDDDFKGIATDYSDPNYLYFSGNRLIRINKTNFNQYQEFIFPNFRPASRIITSNISTSIQNENKVSCYVIHKDSMSSLSLHSFDINNTSFSTKHTQIGTGNYQIGSSRIAIASSPDNADLTFFGQVKLKRALNFHSSTSSSFIGVGGYCCNDGIKNNMHGDIHAIAFAPDGSGIYVGTDGGISYWNSATNVNGTNWDTRHTGINNSLIQDFDDSELDNNVILIGLQDNRSASTVSNNIWNFFGAGDGYNTWIDDEHYKYSYYTRGSSFFARNLVTNQDNSENSYLLNGSTPASQSPMQNHPRTGKMIFTMREGLYQKDIKVASSSDSPSDVWSPIVTTLDLGVATSNNQFLYKSEISESNPEYIYAFRAQSDPYGSNSVSGGFFFRKRPNTAWEDVSSSYLMAMGLGGGYHSEHYPVSGLAISPTNPNHLWITISGFNDGYKVYKSIDGGDSFINMDPTNCLPNLPVNDIVYQDGTNDRVYIATDVGVYTSIASSGEWYRYGDIPNVRVNKLKINRCSGTLKASTYGRGLFETDLMPNNGKITSYNTIDNSQTWNEDKALTRNLYIGTNKTLIIDGMTLYMPKNGRIIVQKNAQLILRNGAKITNGCGEMWQGITVVGSTASNQPNEGNVNAGVQFNQGVLRMNNSTLEHAKEAIRLHMSNDLAWPYSHYFNGGVVFAKESFFINNRRSAEFKKYTTDGSESVFEQCEFITNDEYRLEEHTPHHITFWENHGTQILECVFEDQRTSFSAYDNRRATGIFSQDANYVVSAICDAGSIDYSDEDLPCSGTFEPNKFVNLKRAIRAEGTGAQPSNLQILNNEFENCHIGVSLQGMDDAIVLKNEFTQSDNINSIGIYLGTSNNNTVYKNEMQGINVSIMAAELGLQNNNRIYRNTMLKNNLNENGDIAVGVETAANNEKLRIDCNSFNYMYYDFYALPSGSGISLGDQGTNSKPMANTFTNSYTTASNGYLKASNETLGSYDYKAFDEGDMNPQNSSPNINTSIVPGFSYDPIEGCPNIDLRYLVGKNSEDGGSGLALEGYQSILNSLDYTDDEDAVVIDNVLTLLIAHHQNKGEVDEIILLLEHYTDAWHMVQLASFYTLDKRYARATSVLTNLIAGDAITEVKELAEVYQIRNNLEKDAKTWFEMDAMQKTTIKNLARQNNHHPGTIKAKNVLSIVDNMFFEEYVVFPEEEGTSASTTNTEEPLFIQYPNPIDGILNLKYTATFKEPFQVYIYDLISNELVYKGMIESNPFILDVSQWQTGFYSIVITNLEGVEIYKSSTKIKN